MLNHWSFSLVSLCALIPSSLESSALKWSFSLIVASVCDPCSSVLCAQSFDFVCSFCLQVTRTFFVCCVHQGPFSFLSSSLSVVTVCIFFNFRRIPTFILFKKFSRTSVLCPLCLLSPWLFFFLQHFLCL